MRKYIHIGYPKCASTWTQGNFFSIHPQLFHLGKTVIGEVIDDKIRLALWSDFVEKPDFLYDPHLTKSCFQYQFEKAKDMRQKKLVGISFELFTNYMVGKVDLTRRAERALEIFGDDTKILIIIRNQLDFIRSLYTGLIKEGGIKRDFEEFLYYFYFFQDRSPFSSIFFDKTYELYARLFGEKNIYVIPFEILKQSPDEFLRQLCNALEVDLIDSSFVQKKTGSIDKVNPSPSPEVLYFILQKNKKNRLYLGGDPFHPPWTHAIKPLFTQLHNVPIPDFVENDWKILMENAQKSERKVHVLKKLRIKIPQLNLDYPKLYESLLRKSYAPSNRRCSELTGIDLSSLGYPV